jgi:hypothetical protein|tara:strand:- start:709 stop:966 length:258 start_codon:yes stop_codon:yes gene_type:complete
MNDNKIFWKLANSDDIIIPGEYEDFKTYVAKIKKVVRAIDGNTKFITQTFDGGKTYNTINILPIQENEIDSQLTINFKKEKLKDE